ncbi:hypothetical protein [Campylobacter sputorum]|uniref:hypothetical protein n=1 Tax=Campylobacter sputorum TaxID=206 RepID=UPI000AF1817E|nr:hypothetical protein [Campylobacter sputorum]
MIIIGNKYKFNDIELKKLNKKFKNIKFLDYNCSRENSILTRKKIKNLLQEGYYKYLVINSDCNIDKKMIKFLTLVQFRYRRKAIKVISVKKLLEKYLEKLYIPDDDKNLEFLTDMKTYNGFEYILKRFIDISVGIFLYIIIFF